MYTRLLRSFAALLAALLVVIPTQAQNFPARPIKIIVGFAPGSGADMLGRLWGQKLSDELGTPVIVENKPGAGQIVAVQALKLAPPDGHTLYLATGSSLGQGPGMRKDLPYDPLKDFSLVSHIGTTPGAIYIRTNLPIRSLSELVDYARANPGKLSFASAGVGSAGHLCAELFMARTGAKLFHIPYKSDADAAKEVAAGTVDMAFALARFAIPLAKADKLRPLMAIDAHRLSELPEVPSAEDSRALGLQDMAPYTYYGMVGPAGMPAAVVQRLNAAMVKIAGAPEMAAQMQTLYVAPSAGSSAAFRSLVEKDTAKWRELGKSVKIEF